MSLAPIVLFCYNRLDQLERTVEALRANELAIESELFIFSDGPKNEDDAEKVKIVREYIRAISGFRSVEIREAEKNCGLAASIIAGVTEVVEQYGRVIVLEDDLVTSPFFLRFMNDTLDFYEPEVRVAGIHAYLPPYSYPAPETFFIREVGCLGWATWKRGWADFEADGKKLLDGFTSKKMIRDFNVGNSYPFYEMLKAQVAGKCNSWAIRWYASVFLKGKLGLQPGRNLVSHIGYSGGTHFSEDSFEVAEEVSKCCPKILSIPIEANEDMLKNYYAPYYQSSEYMPSLKDRILRKIKKSFILGRNHKTLFSQVKYCLPYGFVRLIQSKRTSGIEYAGDYRTWQEAQQNALGYDAPNIIEKVKSSTQKVINGEAVFERDSVLFYQKDYNWPLLSAFGYLAAKLRGHLHVLDFGGALGSTYWQNRKILREIAPDLSWHVVEQQGFLDVAKTLHYDEPLFFHKSIEEAKKSSAIKVVLFSSVLQYIDDWESIINSIADIDFILIDRSPEFVEKMDSQIMVQHVPEAIYQATYPVRIFGKDHWLKVLQGVYMPVLSWNSTTDETAYVKDCEGKINSIHFAGGLFAKRRNFIEKSRKVNEAVEKNHI